MSNFIVSIATGRHLSQLLHDGGGHIPCVSVTLFIGDFEELCLQMTRRHEDIRNFRLVKPKPPVLVIDEATLRKTYDAGPVCECRERYEAVKSLKPFLPGGTGTPFRKRIFSDDDCLEIFWVRRSIEPRCRHFIKPIAHHRNEIPDKYYLTRQPREDLMFIKVPPYDCPQGKAH